MHLTNIFNPSLFIFPDSKNLAIRTSIFLLSGLPLFCYPGCKILAIQYSSLSFRVYHFRQNHLFCIMTKGIHPPCPFHAVLPF